MAERRRYTKAWEVLIGDEIRSLEDIESIFRPTEGTAIEREPLLKFSFYLSTRNNQLAEVADEILDLLDSGISGNSINYGDVGRAGTLMWLWTLGAYEVIRTMCQAKNCFSELAMTRLMNTKKILAKVRMPDAKMEKPGKKKPVTSSRSPFAEDTIRKDLIIGDPFDSYSAREIIDKYFSTLDSLTPSDVIAAHESSYEQI